MYNCKIYHYASGKQIRLYLKPIETEKEYEKEERTEERESIPDKARSLYVSMNRTKQAIYGIARANQWDLFLTLTFDRNKVDSSDYESVSKKARKWLNHLKERVAPDLKYLLIPELHADNQHWHLHGLLADCPELELVDSGHKKNDRTIYNLGNWKYGFSTVSKIESQQKVSGYITKYITKELCSITSGKRRYWSSKNCITAEQVCEYSLMSDEDIADLITSSNIDYVKSQKIPEARQMITYVDIC